MVPADFVCFLLLLLSTAARIPDRYMRPSAPAPFHVRRPPPPELSPKTIAIVGENVVV